MFPFNNSTAHTKHGKLLSDYFCGAQKQEQIQNSRAEKPINRKIELLASGSFIFYFNLLGIPTIAARHINNDI